MTVKELKQKLAKMDDKEYVAITLEDDAGLQFFDLIDVSSHRGTPMRTPDGEAGYTFESSGPANWTFIQIEKA